MDEKFTGRAREALENAAGEAARFGQGSIGPTHLLLGILSDPDSTASTVLKGLGVDLGRLRDELERGAAAGTAELESRGQFTPAALQVIELAIGAASSTGNAYVATQHLLLGVIRENTSEAAGVLRTNGLDDQMLLTEVGRHTGLNLASLMSALVGEAEPQGTNALMCEVCGARPATVHYTEIHNRAMLERHLCGLCSNDLGT